MNEFTEKAITLETKQMYEWLTDDWIKRGDKETDEMFASKVDNLAIIILAKTDLFEKLSDVCNRFATIIRENYVLKNRCGSKFINLVKIMHCGKSTSAEKCNAFFTFLINKIYFPSLTIDIQRNIINQIEDFKTLGRMNRLSKPLPSLSDRSLPFFAIDALMSKVNSVRPSMSYQQIKNRFRDEKAKKFTSANLIPLNLVDDTLSELVVNYPNITNLSLKFCEKITDSGTACLTKLSSLKCLDFNYCHKLSDASLAHLSRLSNLESLNLETCNQITDLGLHQLRVMTTLKYLDLGFCNITDKGIAHLNGLTNLVDLNLCKCTISNDSINHLIKLTNLNKLSLYGASDISNKNIVLLNTLTKLNNLDLGYCKLKNKGLSQLSRLNLSFLSLYECRHLTDEGMASLNHMISLENLNLSFCRRLTNNGLFHLTNLTNLKILDLNFLSNITDNGLSSGIAQITSLKLLNIKGCPQLTDNGLRCLTSLKKLESLELGTSSPITEESIWLFRHFTNLNVKVIYQT
jgi:hypothetical protein